MVWVCFLYWEKHHRFPPDKTETGPATKETLSGDASKVLKPTSWPQDPSAASLTILARAKEVMNRLNKGRGLMYIGVMKKKQCM